MVNQKDSVEPLRLAFVCEENAGRSQIAAAIAEAQVRIQSRTDIEIFSDGTSRLRGPISLFDEFSTAE